MKGHGVTSAMSKAVMAGALPIKRHVGRPTKYSDALADRICDLMKGGESLVAVCNRSDMPDRITIIRWSDRYPDFATKLFAARASQADLCDDMMFELSKTSTAETAAADNVKFKILAWRAGRLNAKRYGDKTESVNTMKHEVTHIHLVAPDSDENATIDGDFTLLPHPLEQED